MIENPKPATVGRFSVMAENQLWVWSLEEETRGPVLYDKCGLNFESVDKLFSQTTRRLNSRGDTLS